MYLDTVALRVTEIQHMLSSAIPNTDMHKWVHEHVASSSLVVMACLSHATVLLLSEPAPPPPGHPWHEKHNWNAHHPWQKLAAARQLCTL
jgi:hypothetical protein